jgi:ketosteroid isomerase-like protein
MSEAMSRFEAEWSIAQAVGRMMGACDDQDWDTVLKCVAEDFELVALNQPVRVRGAQAFVAWQKTVLPPATRAQHILGPVVVSISGDRADASALSTSYIFPVGEPEAPIKKSGTKNTYHLRRDGGLWKIASCDVTAMWQEGGKLLANPVDIGPGSKARAPGELK